MDRKTTEKRPVGPRELGRSERQVRGSGLCRICLPLTALSALAVALPARAEEGTERNMDHRHSALACRAVPGSATPGLWGQYGIANDSSTSDLQIVCPLDNAYPGNNTSASYYEVDVVVYDRHASKNVSCRVTVTDYDGNVTSNNSGTSFGSQSGSQKIRILSNGLTNDRVWSLWCTIPPTQNGQYSHVVSYVVPLVD